MAQKKRAGAEPTLTPSRGIYCAPNWRRAGAATWCGSEFGKQLQCFRTETLTIMRPVATLVNGTTA